MFIADLHSCETFISGDNAIRRELLHPDKAPLKLRHSLVHTVVKPSEAILHYYMLSKQANPSVEIKA